MKIMNSGGEIVNVPQEYEEVVRQNINNPDYINSLVQTFKMSGIPKAQPGLAVKPGSVPQGFFLNPGYYKKTPADFHVYQEPKTYTPGQNASPGTTDPMVGMDDPFLQLALMGYGWATKVPQTGRFLYETAPVKPGLGEAIGTAADAANVNKGIKFSKAPGARRYPKEIAVETSRQAGAEGFPRIFSEKMGKDYNTSLWETGSMSKDIPKHSLSEIKQVAHHGKVPLEKSVQGPFITSTEKEIGDISYIQPSDVATKGALQFRDPSLWWNGQLNNSMRMADLNKEAMTYLPAIKYAAKNINPVEAMDLWRTYYSPHRDGGPTPSKAHEMLKDGTAHGKPLTDKQKRYFGYIYGSSKKQYGGNNDHLSVYPMAMSSGGISDGAFPNQMGEYTNNRLSGFLNTVKDMAQKAALKEMMVNMQQPMQQPMDQQFAEGGSTPYQNGLTAGTGWLAKHGGEHNLPKAQYGPPTFDQWNSNQWNSPWPQGSAQINTYRGPYNPITDFIPNVGQKSYNQTSYVNQPPAQQPVFNEGVTDPSSGAPLAKPNPFTAAEPSQFNTPMWTDQSQQIRDTALKADLDKLQQTQITDPLNKQKQESLIQGAKDIARVKPEEVPTISSKTKRPNWKNRWWASPEIWNTGMEAVTNFANRIDEAKKENQLRKQRTADYLFNPVVGNRGDYTANYGYFRPDQMVPVQFPGAAGSYHYQYGGSPNDGMYMTEDEIQQILANGGEIEYLD